MRDPKRLDGFYGELCKIHAEHFPDWRFGQLCSNFFGWLYAAKRVDLFFPEEDVMIKYLREYAKCVFDNPEDPQSAIRSAER